MCDSSSSDSEVSLSCCDNESSSECQTRCCRHKSRRYLDYDKNEHFAMNNFHHTTGHIQPGTSHQLINTAFGYSQQTM